MDGNLSAKNIYNEQMPENTIFNELIYRWLHGKLLKILASLEKTKTENLNRTLNQDCFDRQNIYYGK